MCKMKSIPTRFSKEQIQLIEDLSQRLCISKSEVIRQFVDKDKVIVIDGFDKILSYLAVLTEKVQMGNDISSDNYIIFREAVNKLWQSLSLSMNVQ